MTSHPPSSFTFYGLFALFWVLVSAFQYGFHISVLNQINDVLTCRAPPGAVNSTTPTFGLPSCIALSDAQFSAVTASFTVGGLLGSLLGTPLTARRGRRGALVVDGVITAVGAGLMTLAPNMSVLLLGRTLTGIGAGIGVSVGPVFLGELAPPSARGSVGVLFQLSIVFGILTTEVLGFGLASPTIWRIVPFISAVLALAQIIAGALVAESHAWLARNGRTQEAQHVRERLWVDGGGAAYETVGGDDVDVEDNLEDDPLDTPAGSMFPTHSSKSLSLLQLLRTPELRNPLLVVVFAMAAQQLSGINAVLYYSNAILGKTLPTFAPFVSIGITVVNAAMTFPPIFLIDRMGRKALLNISILGGLASLLAVGYSIDTGRKVLASVAIIAFVASFACGLGPVPFVVISDIAPYHAVAALSSAALSLNWIANFAVGLVFLPLRNFLSWGDPLSEGRVFYVFAAALALFGGALNMVYREQRERR
ncbi:general substrate transporter [Phellopilus nigrolimitatus]|nr:general substrate transporter [Phellopilus nigrolimitatus]